MRPQVGDEAPDFELEGTEGPFRLSDHRSGRQRVVGLSYQTPDNLRAALDSLPTPAASD
jgi:hypothetical protein